MCKIVDAELAQFREKPAPEAKPSVVPDVGVVVTPQEKAKAVDYRAVVLMGKGPEEAGLLLNSWDVAKLMSVSRRTWRLHRLSGRIWRRTPIKLAQAPHKLASCNTRVEQAQ